MAGAEGAGKGSARDRLLEAADRLVYARGGHAGGIDAELARADSPTQQILAVYDALADLFAQPDFRGCAFINAAAEAPDGSAEELATKDFRSWLHELFGAFATGTGYPGAERLALQLVMLYDGANISAQL